MQNSPYPQFSTPYPYFHLTSIFPPFYRPSRPSLLPHFSFASYLFFMEQSQDHPLQRESDIYKRIRLLGSGSYGRAYLVRQVATGQEWAIKQVDLADLSPQEQTDAMREAKILELLRHPNIVRFKEVYRTAKGKLNLVMEYAEGGDLAERIKKAKQTAMPFSEEQVLSWFVQVCLAVRHLHDSKVIHRDLKPQNIFLTGDNLVKVGDFGVSRLMENTVARARTVVGSPYYLSPQIVENKPYSFKTDIWSLGTLLFQLCALHPPFSAGNLQALALKIVQGGYTQIPRQYSEGVRGLLKWMLQTKQANRPTIHQVLLSPVIASRIHKFIADSQLHKSTHNVSLKPPPNLIALEQIENRSQVILSKNYEEKEEESPARAKAKTPQVGVRKGPNNFFNRPVSGKRKMETPCDLADLIQIKPSLIQAHEKPQRMVVPLPKVPKTSLAILPKPKSQPIKQKEKPMPLVTNSAFVKKRTSFTQMQAMKKEEIKPLPIPTARKSQKKEKSITANQKEKPLQKKKVMGANNNIKPQIRKKVSKPPSQTKLQICSQQIKKKEQAPPKPQRKVQKKKERPPKRPNTQQPPSSPKLQQAMQQQKCNSQQDLNSNPSSHNLYYQDVFQSYSGSDDDDIELSLSDTLSPTPINTYEIMLREMESIRAAIQEEPDCLPAGGQSIPELLQFSNCPRVDDDDLDIPTNTSNGINIEKPMQFPQSQLESLRVNLQQIFGVENIIFAYHWIEQKIREMGLGLNQQKTVREIMEGRPQIDQAMLQAYFRLIVTIVGVEMGLL